MNFAPVNKAVKTGRSTEDQFERIFRKYFVRLCCFANRYTRNTEESKEIVQDVFLQVWNKRNQLVFDDEIQSYLFRAVKNFCLNLLQHKRVIDDYQSVLYLLYSHHEQERDWLPNLELNELNTKIEEAVAALPAECRRIFLMSREEGMKYVEIASQLKISVKTVETQMSRALSKLRLSLREYLS